MDKLHPGKLILCTEIKKMGLFHCRLKKSSNQLNSNPLMRMMIFSKKFKKLLCFNRIFQREMMKRPEESSRAQFQKLKLKFQTFRKLSKYLYLTWRFIMKTLMICSIPKKRILKSETTKIVKAQLWLMEFQNLKLKVYKNSKII